MVRDPPCQLGAQQAVAADFNSVELAKITGHRDPKMLKRYYNPTDAEQVAKIRAAAAHLRHTGSDGGDGGGT